MKPLFSVIIPTFNRAAFIKRSIGSVLDQDCVYAGDIQIIVIDDGSGDQTDQIVSKIDPGKHSIIYEKIAHIGQPGTVRNLALKKVEGDFVCYCDSDDLWLPHHLATAMQEFKKYPHLYMVSNFWGLAKFTVCPDGRILNEYVVPPHPKNIVNTNCRVHRKECLNVVSSFNTSCWGEDQDFFGRIETKYPQSKTGIVTSVNGYIRGGNNLTYLFDQGVKQRYYT